MTIIRPNAKPPLWWLFPWSYARTLHMSANALKAYADRQDQCLEILRGVIEIKDAEIRTLKARVADQNDAIIRGTAITPDATPMSNFKHPDGMRALLSEVYEVNERIMTGDIVSPKAAIALTNMKKMLSHYYEALHEDGATKVSLQAYIAAGGWVGITYSYEMDGFEVAGSQVPRRV